MACGGADCDEGGFIAADGLVALTLVAIVLGLVLNAVAISLKASRAAAERRLAMVEAEYRLLSQRSAVVPGSSASGAEGRLSWSLNVARREAEPDLRLAICDVSSVVREGRRRVELKTIAFCPADAP